MILQTVAFILMSLWIRLLVVAFSKLFRSKHNRIERLYKYLLPGLFFNDFISLYLTTYFELTISSILTIQFGEYTTYGERLSLSISIFSIAMGMIFIPFSSLWVVFAPKRKLKEKRSMIGKLIQYIRMKDKLAKAYTFIITSRRLSIIGMAFIEFPIY